MRGSITITWPLSAELELEGFLQCRLDHLLDCQIDGQDEVDAGGRIGLELGLDRDGRPMNGDRLSGQPFIVVALDAVEALPLLVDESQHVASDGSGGVRPLGSGDQIQAAQIRGLRIGEEAVEHLGHGLVHGQRPRVTVGILARQADAVLPHGCPVGGDLRVQVLQWEDQQLGQRQRDLTLAFLGQLADFDLEVEHRGVGRQHVAVAVVDLAARRDDLLDLRCAVLGARGEDRRVGSKLNADELDDECSDGGAHHHQDEADAPPRDAFLVHDELSDDPIQRISQSPSVSV